jgi:ubiquinone/menaquinone biosynthesis C-methylase UbiE
MHLNDIIERNKTPRPWTEGYKIPWDESEFSRRMLNEHLTQRHDMASPRFAKIDKHVEFIQTELVKKQPTRILDLCCGPGLYTSRLAKLGHSCTGIDFSPASVEYARREATTFALNCKYILDDVRSTDFPGQFGLAMMLHGEMNAFSKDDIRLILSNAYKALEAEGILLLTASTIDGIKPRETTQKTWTSRNSGLFSELPHLQLFEKVWDEKAKAVTERYYIIDAKTGDVAKYSASLQAYTEAEYKVLLQDCGFKSIQLLPPLFGMQDFEATTHTVVARK